MPKPRKKKITTKEFKRLRHLLQDGYAIEEVAKQIGIDVKYIKNLYYKFKNTNFPF